MVGYGRSRGRGVRVCRRPRRRWPSSDPRFSKKKTSARARRREDIFFAHCPSDFSCVNPPQSMNAHYSAVLLRDSATIDTMVDAMVEDAGGSGGGEVRRHEIGFPNDARERGRGTRVRDVNDARSRESVWHELGVAEWTSSWTSVWANSLLVMWHSRCRTSNSALTSSGSSLTLPRFGIGNESARCSGGPIVGGGRCGFPNNGYNCFQDPSTQCHSFPRPEVISDQLTDPLTH